MKKCLFSVMVAAAMMTACKNGSQQPQMSSDEDQMSYVLRDTTIYGFCAEGSAMNTLQIITDAGDTISISTARAREKNKVFGGYAVGDEIAVIANADTTQAVLVINKSMLNGDWVMPNPLDGSNEMGIRIMRGGAAESIDQSTIVYKSWRIFNGKLQVVATREDGIDMEEYQDFDLVKLTADSLVLRSNDEENEVLEYGHPHGEEYTEDDLKGIIIDEGLDDEYNM